MGLCGAATFHEGPASCRLQGESCRTHSQISHNMTPHCTIRNWLGYTAWPESLRGGSTAIGPEFSKLAVSGKMGKKLQKAEELFDRKGA